MILAPFWDFLLTNSICCAQVVHLYVIRDEALAMLWYICIVYVVFWSEPMLYFLTKCFLQGPLLFFLCLQDQVLTQVSEPPQNELSSPLFR